MKWKSLLIKAAVVIQIAVLCFILQFLYEINQGRAVNDALLEDEEEVSSPVPSHQTSEVPFAHFVEGVGSVAPSSGYIHVTAPFPGVVKKVIAKEGDLIDVGALLFQMDDSSYVCALEEKKAEYETALAEVNLKRRGPSDSDLIIKEKEIAQKEITYHQKLKEQEVFKLLLAENAVSEHEKEDRDIELQLALIDKEIAIAEYERLKRGVSLEEKEFGIALVAEKETHILSIEQKIKECAVRSPLKGRVLESTVHEGEFIDPSSKVALVIGSENPLYLEVAIPENEAWRISPAKGLRAIAAHPSNPKMQFILDFVGVKPCMQSSEEETKSLIILFSFDKGKAPIYCEQNLNVYIEAAPSSDTSYLYYQFNQLKR